MPSARRGLNGGTGTRSRHGCPRPASARAGREKVPSRPSAAPSDRKAAQTGRTVRASAATPSIGRSSRPYTRRSTVPTSFRCAVPRSHATPTDRQDRPPGVTQHPPYRQNAPTLFPTPVWRTTVALRCGRQFSARLCGMPEAPPPGSSAPGEMFRLSPVHPALAARASRIGLVQAAGGGAVRNRPMPPGEADRDAVGEQSPRRVESDGIGNEDPRPVLMPCWDRWARYRRGHDLPDHDRRPRG